MHICYLTRNYDERAQGGRNPSMRHYSRRLRELGHRVTIVSVPMHPENANTVDDNVHFTNYFASLSYDTNLAFSIWRLYSKTCDLHRASPFDLIHCLYREFDGIAAVLLRWRLKLRLVQWMYDRGYESQKASLIETKRSRVLLPFLLMYLKYGERFVLNNADRVLAIGQDIIDVSLAPRGYQAPKVVLVNNTVDARQFTPRAPDPRELEKYTVKRPLVLMVARIDPLKGIKEFLHVAAAVHRRRPEVNFLVVGRDKDNMLPTYLSLARELGVVDCIQWQRERQDVQNLYPVADCVMICTLPTLGGVSNVLLEAMASGKVVVANRACGVPYVIRDWVNGVSIPDNEPEQFAEAIVRVLTDCTLRMRLEQEARQTVEREFSLEKSADRLVQVYESLMAR
ncbi:MAG: glycosyltransferase family 4 protein [Candidatus Riflebacteria bacterium]|nr:glycosyltransferase family 4 protein [Candidatus Riflebacteria bacterium]